MAVIWNKMKYRNIFAFLIFKSILCKATVFPFHFLILHSIRWKHFIAAPVFFLQTSFQGSLKFNNGWAFRVFNKREVRESYERYSINICLKQHWFPGLHDKHKFSFETNNHLHAKLYLPQRNILLVFTGKYIFVT